MLSVPSNTRNISHPVAHSVTIVLLTALRSSLESVVPVTFHEWVVTMPGGGSQVYASYLRSQEHRLVTWRGMTRKTPDRSEWRPVSVVGITRLAKDWRNQRGKYVSPTHVSWNQMSCLKLANTYLHWYSYWSAISQENTAAIIVS